MPSFPNPGALTRRTTLGALAALASGIAAAQSGKRDTVRIGY